MLMTKTIC